MKTTAQKSRVGQMLDAISRAHSVPNRVMVVHRLTEAVNAQHAADVDTLDDAELHAVLTVAWTLRCNGSGVQRNNVFAAAQGITA